MEKCKTFEDLFVWQKAHQFVLSVYALTSTFPKSEIYGLTPQLRRAAISIPANIAEGFKRISKKEKLRFYNISQASIEECKYYLILSRDLKYGSDGITSGMLEETSKLLERYMYMIKNSGQRKEVED